MGKDQGVVVVLQSADAVEIEIGKNLLDKAGIPCAIKGGSASAYITTVLGQSFGGIQSLLVPAEYEQRAFELLEEAWGPEAGEDGAD